MEKSKIEEYIENGLELELLDKLNSYVISGFDNTCENLIKTLIILQEKAKIDWRQPNQALVNIITKILPDVLKTQDDLQKFLQIIRDSAEPFEKISYLNRQFIIGIQDKDPKLSNTGVSEKLLESFRSELKDLNLYFLKKAISIKLSYETISTLFYNCVEKLEDERRIILIDEAIEIYRSYLSADPKEYLISFIRPYYTGPNKLVIDYYLHVAEPFHKQIFSVEKVSFNDFINSSKERASDELINDIRNFYNKVLDINAKDPDGRVILYSKEMESPTFVSFNGPRDTGRDLKLNSNEHIGARKECLPPLYQS